jgi:hypothetical protein
MKKMVLSNENALRFFKSIDPCREMSSATANQGTCRCGSYAETSTFVGIWDFVEYVAALRGIKKTISYMKGLVTCPVSPFSLTRLIWMPLRIGSSYVLESIQLSRKVSIEMLISLILKKLFSEKSGRHSSNLLLALQNNSHVNLHMVVHACLTLLLSYSPTQ